MPKNHLQKFGLGFCQSLCQLITPQGLAGPGSSKASLICKAIRMREDRKKKKTNKTLDQGKPAGKEKLFFFNVS